MTKRLVRRPLLTGGAAVALVALGGAAIADGASTSAPDPQTGHWHGLTTADGSPPDVTFRIVHTRTGDEIRDFSITMPEVCADPTGGPSTETTTGFSVKRMRISRNGHFKYTDNAEEDLSGRVTRSREIAMTASVAPVGLTCSGGDQRLVAGPVAAQRLVKVRSSGRTVRLKVGDGLVLDLEENPSTGFSWRQGTRPGVLARVSSAYTAPAQSDPPMPGAAGRRTIAYDAVRSGHGTLRMVYRAPGSDRSGDRRLTVKVIVKR